MSESTVERPQERIPTGVPGLDIVLHGGLLRGGVYMLQGRPGAGKTILTNQMCFHHAAQGGRVLYSTLLAETHERLLFNLEPLSFFDTSRIPEQIAYLSAFSTLEQGGLKGLVEVLRREARARKSTLLVVDGLVTAEESAQSKREFKKFIHELQIHANLVGCTILLLTSSSAETVGPEHTMVDGVLELFDNRLGRRAERELEVRKFRGSSYLRGGHAFQITQDGIVVHPRIEALLQNPSRLDPCRGERVSTGIAQLDKMLHGGLPCASTSVLFGPTGAGKTTFGLHFLDESSKSEPGLLFGFYETPPPPAPQGPCAGARPGEEAPAGHLRHDVALAHRAHPPSRSTASPLGASRSPPRPSRGHSPSSRVMRSRPPGPGARVCSRSGAASREDPPRGGR
ncbi:ATPase domain-containing protein [Archangium lansingense]|uniref:RAD55 family ATPase n=1 Tax=Archangium lansingense TaxID=2995310 RepID=UPI003B7ADDBD